ncbi:3-oxoacyl-[acyl-carrier protein] reductase [Filimonas lacunae]|nr:3-oxoacyl-[acyl-carrier protein] reductase [Filimonas lacunae]
MVTGGSRGIGAAIVQKLAAEGASIAFTYVNSAEKANAIVKELEKAGTKALAIQADSSLQKDVAAAVAQTAQHFGRLDILVNNAAVFVIGPIEDADKNTAQYDRQIDINIRSIATAIREAAKYISDNGRIITISSAVANYVGTAHLTDYAATKAAASSYSRGYAHDLGKRGITVNAVQPGPVDTDMNPDSGAFADAMRSKTALGRYGKAEEIAALVGFLAGPDAAYITGASITIDGGLSA